MIGEWLGMCRKRKELPKGMINDLINIKYAKDVKKGMRIGRWIVVEDYNGTKSNSGIALIQVQCSCSDATIKYVAFSDLKRNSQISCGCYRREYVSKTMKGKKHTEQHKRKNSEAQKFLVQQEGYVNSFKGHHHTEETKQKISEALKNPDITDEERERKRNIVGYDKWKQQVKEQTNYICDCCGYVGEKNDGIMRSHHLNDFHSNEELRTELSNGVCLCKWCHDLFHNKYMGGNSVECTEQDYIEFKEQKQLNSDTNAEDAN